MPLKSRVDIPKDTEISEDARTKLEAKKKLIEGRRAMLETLHNEISEHCDIDSVEKEIVERGEVESEIEEIICLTEHALADTSHPAATVAPQTKIIVPIEKIQGIA